MSQSSKRLHLPEEEIEFQIAALRLGPGDVLVARANKPCPSEALARIRAYLERSLPGAKVVVIDALIDLSVVSKAEGKRIAAVSGEYQRPQG